MNAYLAGFALGLVLLAAFVIMGRGLGASGAFNSVLATLVYQVAPKHALSNSFYTDYLGDLSRSPLLAWLVFEVLGVFVGGFISAALGHRLKAVVERGPNIGIRNRLLFAFIGGAIMLIGAKIALGCTSGQALTGGSLLNVGSWIFMLCVFGGAYGMAYFFRKQWY